MCTGGATLAGTFGGPFLATGWMNDPAEDGAPFKPAFTGCTTTSPFPPKAATVTCAMSVNLVAITIASSTVGLELRVFTCTVQVPTVPSCLISIQGVGPNQRATAAAYANATSKLDIASTGQTFAATWSGCTTVFPSPSGTSSATLGPVSGPALSYTATSSPAPAFTP